MRHFKGLLVQRFFRILAEASDFMRVRGLPHRVAASKQSRYLRDVSRAVEALVLSAWYATSGVQPSSHLQAHLPALHCSSDGQAALTAPVLAEMLDVVSYSLAKDGTLGPERSSSRPPELRAAMSEGISQAVRTADGISGLSNLLGLDDAPTRLETFDISHLYGTNTVGACSALSLGMTALDDYCCYPIHGVTPADDYGAIEAALREHLGSDVKRPPSVLLIDGGKGQLSAAMAVLSELGLEDTVAPLALAKREEEIFLPRVSQPIVLPRTSPTLTLLRRQRDEAHAFALLSHRLLRASNQLTSVLDGCGLSMMEQATLRSSFGSASALRAASVGEVGEVLGEGSSIDARLVLSRLRSQCEPVAVGFQSSLAGHPSAVQALALSTRRTSPRLEAWGVEEQARKWWSVRRGPWLSRLERGGSAASRAVDDVLHAVEGLLSPATPLSNEAASAGLHRALNSWGTEGGLQQAGHGGAATPSDAAGPSLIPPSSEGELTVSSSTSSLAMPGAFKLHAPYPTAGDQPAAIESLVADVQAGSPYTVLKGATGTGKTFVLANLIDRTNRPTLIVAPNKVLAAQLFTELKSFFPQNSVTIFFSHFDFYRPESYAPVSQSYVEKASQTNPKIDALRHEATRSLFERRDTIVVATVSCI